jgi:positive regulator of sigma E activity
MKETVDHIGEIIRVSAGEIRVLLQETAEQCDGCAISGMCGGKSDNKLDIQVEGASRYQVGQRVVVSARPSSTLKGVALTFVIPCAILVAVVLALSLNGVKEIIGISVGLGLMVVYDLILYFFFRTKVNGVVKWDVRLLDD